MNRPTETHHGCGDRQDKSILGPFDNTTFAGPVTSTTRARRCGHMEVNNRQRASGLKIPETFLLRAHEVIE
jgi:hypothetical protein